MADRVPCQVCGRGLVPLRDGTSRYHVARRGHGDYCPGSRHRMARWPVGQQLRHHSGDRWEIVEDRGGRWGDYYLRCLWGREQGREMVGHGEYMHRHGWTPVLELSSGFDSRPDLESATWLTWRWRMVADPNRPHRTGRIAHPLAARFGERCRLICQGSNGNRLVEFDDGFRTVAPLYATRGAP